VALTVETLYHHIHGQFPEAFWTLHDGFWERATLVGAEGSPIDLELDLPSSEDGTSTYTLARMRPDAQSPLEQESLEQGIREGRLGAIFGRRRLLPTDFRVTRAASIDSASYISLSPEQLSARIQDIAEGAAVLSIKQAQELDDFAYGHTPDAMRQEGLRLAEASLGRISLAPLLMAGS
jgi:hypothetical protein